jgi:hypothetical protein
MYSGDGKPNGGKSNGLSLTVNLLLKYHSQRPGKTNFEDLKRIRRGLDSKPRRNILKKGY